MSCTCNNSHNHHHSHTNSHTSLNRCGKCNDLGCKDIIYPGCILTKVSYPCIGIGAGKTGDVLFAAIDSAICALSGRSTVVEGCTQSLDNGDYATITSTATVVGGVTTYKVCLGSDVIEFFNEVQSSLILNQGEIDNINITLESATGCLFDGTGGCEIDNLQISITTIEDDIITINNNIVNIIGDITDINITLSDATGDIEQLKDCIYDASGNCPTDGAWRLVGSVGQPPFNSTLSQLTPGSGIDLSFRLNREGKLALRGGFDVDADLNTGDSIFTLPTGYRPNALTIVTGMVQDTAKALQFEINNVGDVSIKGPIGVIVTAGNIIRIPEFIISLD